MLDITNDQRCDGLDGWFRVITAHGHEPGRKCEACNEDDAQPDKTVCTECEALAKEGLRIGRTGDKTNPVRFVISPRARLVETWFNDIARRRDPDPVKSAKAHNRCLSCGDKRSRGGAPGFLCQTCDWMFTRIVRLAGKMEPQEASP